MFKKTLLKSEETVELLGIYLDYKLNFEQHISEICRKAASQLNVLKRLQRFIAFNEKKILIQSFIFYYGISLQLIPCKKLRKSKNVLLDSYTMTN